MNANIETIPIRATELLVDTLNHVVELDGGSTARLELLLQRLKLLLGRDTRCALWLIDQLSRRPAPRICTRIVSPGPHEQSQDVGIVAAQQAFDDSSPMTDIMLSKTLASIRTPMTLVASQSAGEWFQITLRPKYLDPMGYADCMASMWASSRNRAICLLCHRRASEPEFGERDATLMSLMLRAAAPIIDRELFQSGDSEEFANLTPREREILLLLLSGDSEKEIAQTIHRSTHTVHTFVQKLYHIFNVSSRGELMAKFVDKAILTRLRQADNA